MKWLQLANEKAAAVSCLLLQLSLGESTALRALDLLCKKHTVAGQLNRRGWWC